MIVALEIVITFVILLTLMTKPLGLWMLPIAQGQAPGVLARIDGALLRLLGLRDPKGTSWSIYALNLLAFNMLGVIFLYALLLLQGHLPLNPQGVTGLTPSQAFNVAISFVTNTNWQSYSGEVALSPLTQMLGLTLQNFLSAATGIAVAFAVMRGFARHETNDIGNFWVDVTRISLYVLLPLSFIFALFLVSQGSVQTLMTTLTVDGHLTAAGVATHAHAQTIAMGPVASQEAIKLIGTNGGGYFNANSAHPFENPNALTNFIECLAILWIAAALTYTFGKLVKDTRQGWTIWGAMCLLFVLAFFAFHYGEVDSGRYLAHLGVDPGLMNMEGKETRFALADTTLYSVVTTAASCGSVNAMMDSLAPLSGMVSLLLILLGEVVFGGAGAGFYTIIIFVLIAVFVAGLMVGRTPEYLGKKITPSMMKITSLAMLITPILVLMGVAITVLYPQALTSLGNPQAHGFSEVLYAWGSAANNNGSAFAGLNANTPFYNIGLGIAMWLGRFGLIILMLALAGSLARARYVPPSSGTLSTYGLLFCAFLVGVIILVGALTYLPALGLGPVADFLSLHP